MNDIPIADVRNFVLAGHTGSGKTTLVDALLYKLGLNDRMGSPAAGTSAADYNDEERARKITLFAKPFSGVYQSAGGKKIGIVMTDTPGYMDFFGQVIASTRAAETGVLVVDAASGLQVGSYRVWKCFEKAKMAKAIVVAGVDRENADFWKTLEQIRGAFGAKCAPVTAPSDDGKKVVSIIASGSSLPDSASKAREALGSLIEIAAETNDSLIEKYLNGEQLSADEIAGGLRDAVARGSLVPVFCVSAPKELGLSELLEGIAALLPSPSSVKVLDAEGKEVPTAPDAPFTGFVWRVVNDPFIGQMTFVRVVGGTLRPEGEILNASKDQKERLSSIVVLNGKKASPVERATAGDIVAIPKLKATSVCDTLCAVGTKVILPRMEFPQPVAIMCVTAKTQADEDKLGVALNRVAEEDPTLKVERNRETKQTLLAGLGDVHLDVAVEMMKNRSKVDVALSLPKVAYRETVTAVGDGHYKHKKQTGGRGQYGEVYLKVQPKAKDDKEWFEDAIVGGAIPGNFIPAVQKGVLEGMAAGTVAGYPVQDVKVVVYDGSYHEVDSSEIAFKIAASRAFRDAMGKARPVLLEPIMTVKVWTPDAFMGDINGDLNHKRGRILGMDTEDGMQVITAEVPQAELFRYAAELRSITGGQGSFEMTFSRYDVVPSNVAQKIIAAAAAEKKKEEEED